MGFLLNDPHDKCNRILSKHSLLTFTVFEMEEAKFAILWDMRNFYFSSDFDGFFSLDSSQWVLSKLCLPIFFTISHHFWDNFGQRGKKKFSRRKLLFCRAHLTDFEKKLIYLKINIQHNCVKHVSVSNTLLCHVEYWKHLFPTFTCGHAALAKDLSS